MLLSVLAFLNEGVLDADDRDDTPRNPAFRAATDPARSVVPIVTVDRAEHLVAACEGVGPGDEVSLAGAD